MTDIQQKTAVRKFAVYWKDKGYEKGQSQTFWLTLLSDVLNVKDVGDFLTPRSVQKAYFLSGKCASHLSFGVAGYAALQFCTLT